MNPDGGSVWSSEASDYTPHVWPKSPHTHTHTHGQRAEDETSLERNCQADCGNQTDKDFTTFQRESRVCAKQCQMTFWNHPERFSRKNVWRTHTHLPFDFISSTGLLLLKGRFYRVHTIHEQHAFMMSGITEEGF